jgi:hypothetical protein
MAYRFLAGAGGNAPADKPRVVTFIVFGKLAFVIPKRRGVLGQGRGRCNRHCGQKEGGFINLGRPCFE